MARQGQADRKEIVHLLFNFAKLINARNADNRLSLGAESNNE